MTERLLRRDSALLLALLGALFVLTALYTVFGIGMRMTAIEMTRMAAMRDMPSMTMPGSWGPGYAALVFLMWWMMMMAMMLPSVAPTVLLNAALLRRSGTRRPVAWISALFLIGYLAIWAIFSALAAVTQWRLEMAGIVSPARMVLTDSVAGGVLLLAAGLFQLSPLKRACLQSCRAPVRFLTERRRPGAAGALRMGMEHGAFCLGCCWALMALLFAGGIMNLYWIVGLTVFVALEKLSPFGARLARPAGLALILAGLWVLGRSLGIWPAA
ncbi:DUF2182 domain-containing protein [Thioclava sp. BHET1]|nr:DUF2182 domain-containing protein [Thioclava sp. BHET1]